MCRKQWDPYNETFTMIEPLNAIHNSDHVKLTLLPLSMQAIRDKTFCYEDMIEI